MKRIIDLTLTLDSDMRGVEIQQAKTVEVEGWNAKRIELNSHCGTHMDAPRHFVAGGSTIDTVDLAACIGPARIIDLTPIGPLEPITVERLGAAADAIGQGDRLLLRTDWGRHHGTPEYRDALPPIDLSLAKWLAERSVALIGVEPPSVADVNDREQLTTVHHALLKGGVVIVEGLMNLDQITAETVELIALPLKVLDGDGAPARVVAIELD